MSAQTQIVPVAENPLALEQQVCFALSVAARNVVAVYRPLLEPMGLTHPQYLVMLALWQYEPVSGRELCRLLRLDPGTLSPLLKRLESAGLLKRERDPRDERALAVTLTDKGRALRAQAEQIPRRSSDGSVWTCPSCWTCTRGSRGSSGSRSRRWTKRDESLRLTPPERSSHAPPAGTAG